MIIEDLEIIARMAEHKRVRIELLSQGFCIIARALVHSKGIVENKQIITYDRIEDSQLVKLFEHEIDKTIEGLKQKSRKK